METNFIKADHPAPFDTVGLFTFLRTYARRHNENDANSTVESWEETINRVVSASNSQLHVNFTKDEQKELFTLLYDLKCSVAGRFLWQLGTKTVDKYGLPSLQNCAAVVVDSPIEPFTWTMNLLMLGAGIGFRILPEDMKNIPPIKYAVNVRKDTNDADFIVPDSREGWIKLLGKVLKSHFYSGQSFTYSCTLLRSKGAPIRGFGGLSSGPEVLCEGMAKIDEILNKRSGQTLRPVDALDLMNIIGMIVVSGNVRRSALLALGDCKDLDYLRAKRWDLGNVPNYRAYSNNSVVCNDINEVLNDPEFWEGFQGNGEPYGLINLKLAKSCGRLGETQYPDENVIGFNPCAEQSLGNKETCCLAELYLPRITSKDELMKCAKYMYRICKHSLALPFPDSSESEKIIHANMRMGIGVTGYMQATDEQRSWLSDCYKFLRTFDEHYSIAHGFRKSIKLCTVKPAGTLSLLAGVTSGVHPGFAQQYIRRIRISSESPLIQLAKKHGYPVEYARKFDGTNDHSTQIISFPYQLPKGTILAENCTAVDQLEWMKKLQTEWSDNSVSITVYYRKEELPAIKEWLKLNYNTGVKTVSFLLHSGHGFDQAPLEAITQEQYEEMVSKCKPITSTEGVCFVNESEELLAQNECVGNSCPLR